MTHIVIFDIDFIFDKYLLGMFDFRQAQHQVQAPRRQKQLPQVCDLQWMFLILIELNSFFKLQRRRLQKLQQVSGDKGVNIFSPFNSSLINNSICVDW